MLNVPSEQEVLDFWEKSNTFKKSLEKRSSNEKYVFYDGPPFATGMPHYGHLLCSTIKDIVGRYQTMRGKYVERTWGWDCHGLPIENMIEKNLKIKNGKRSIEALGIANFNDACKSEVLRLDKVWEKIIGRIGRWVDFENSYKTMDKSYMESVWWGFKRLYEKDLIYKSKKVILYCPRCATPLSNFEIAMDNSYQDINENSTVYKYKVINQNDTFILAWSTTPWNKIVTTALAVNPKMIYIKIKQAEQYFYLAKSRLEMLKDISYEIIQEFTGEEITSSLQFELHFDFYQKKDDELSGVIVSDEFVTDDSGTGFVTLAIYGEDDLRVMKANNIQMIEHIDSEGCFNQEITQWAGRKILDCNDEIDESLNQRNLIYRHIPYNHSVPVCYRCNTRLYYAPVPAWFINVQKIKQNLIEKNQEINWYPNHLKNGRFLKGLENAPDWNISRSRYWGTPMPIWIGYDENNNSHIRVIGSIDELKKWSVQELSDIDNIHREHIDDISLWVDDEKTIKGKRISEVFDCWVESGSMPFASRHYPFEDKDDFEKNYPADFVSEYIAQTRAWFYTMHVMSIAIFDKPAFRNVLTSGIILAKDGTKMSKSKNNFSDPMLIVNDYGADSLRFYLVSSPVVLAESLNFSDNDIKNILNKQISTLWNVYTFYRLYNPNDEIKIENLTFDEVFEFSQNVLDKWILLKLNLLIKGTIEAMEKYDLPLCTRTISDFINSFSTWYIRRSRDNFKSENNQNIIKITGYVLKTSCEVIAPFCPFITEQIWQKLLNYNFDNNAKSVHLQDFPKINNFENEFGMIEKMELTRNIVEIALAKRNEKQIKVRQPLPCLFVKNGSKLINELEKEGYSNLIKDEINVKNVVFEFDEKIPNNEIQVELDTNITDELKNEGLIREVIRTVNALRKIASLTISDDIIFYFDGNEKIKNIINSIPCSSSEISNFEDIEFKKEITIDNEKMLVGIKQIK